MHNDDITQILILNKKSISNYETQLFQQELEKFRSHQNRLLQANHKQSALMKELTAAFNSLLQDKRVRSEQSKYESIQRTRSSVINKYKRAYQEFLDLEAGLHGAKNWYTEMKETVESLEKNVESFVNNRRSEGAQLLNQIEEKKSSSKSAQAELEQERLKGLMERMSMDTPASPPKQRSGRPTPAPLFQPDQAPRYGQQSYQVPGQFQVPTSPPPNQYNSSSTPQQHAYQGYASPPAGGQPYGQAPVSMYQQAAYNPSQYGRTPGPTSPPPTSPPPNQTTFGMNAMRGPASPPPNQTSFGQVQGFGTYGAPVSAQHGQHGQHQHQHSHSQGGQQGYVPAGYVPPPPPPGPPPLGPQQTMHYGGQQPQQHQQQQPQQGYGYPQQHQQQHQQQQHQQPQQHDPWAGLNAWK